VAKQLHQREGAEIAGTYLVFGLIWIAASDWALRQIARGDQELYESLQHVKGAFFVLSTAILLYVGAGILCRVRKQNEAEKRQLEDMLRVAQKFEALGSLAATIAHDFNNVVTVIQLNTQLARERVVDHDLNERLADIENAAHSAQKTVGQLMLFLRSKSAAQFELKALPQVVGESIPLLTQALGKRATLSWKAEEGLPHVFCDASAIVQALLNLVSNARDALDRKPDAAVSISVFSQSLRNHRSITAVEPRSGDFVVVEVADNGPGIAPEHQVSVFLPFFTTKAEGKGTGLGLASVWRIMEQHRGWVELLSAPNAGAKFQMYFPVAGPVP
jgi:two-component system, cell cycle sensor histidine kinase and response regulator CckA